MTTTKQERRFIHDLNGLKYNLYQTRKKIRRILGAIETVRKRGDNIPDEKLNKLHKVADELTDKVSDLQHECHEFQHEVLRELDVSYGEANKNMPDMK